jgi:alpha-glucosidase
VWDQTIVLPGSEIGECAAFARKKGETWFVAVMNGTEPRELKIDLAFLAPGNHRAVILSDQPDDPAAFAPSEQEIESGAILTAVMRPSGGFVAMIRSKV